MCPSMKQNNPIFAVSWELSPFCGNCHLFLEFITKIFRICQLNLLKLSPRLCSYCCNFVQFLEIIRTRMKNLNVKRKNNVKRAAMTLLLAVLTTTAWALEQDPADGYYLIGSAQDWQDFATLVQTTPTANAKMTADIDLGDDQTMVGTYAVKYQGTFDGQGHTLTINYNTSSMTIESPQQYLGAAPFRDIQNATIHNLHTAGTVTADKIGATGLVGWAYGENTIERCWSSVDIVSSNNTADTFSGFVFRQDGSLLTMNDCFYSGKIQSVAKTSHAGFVGHHTAGTVVLNNCLVIFADGTDVPATSDRWTKCYTFVRNQDYSQYIITLNHCYYKTALGTEQGTQATTEQLADGTTATALQAGRTEEIWVQDPIINQPMLKTFASLWQDSEGTYCIGTDAGWTAFANGINDGTIAAATNVKLMADITATTMIGSFSGNFNTSKLYSGIFDGNHHTITANINNSSTNYVALISSIRNATIMDLTVTGSISGGQHCSGLVSVADGTNTISNVSISATITGSNSHCAGVLGHSYSSATTINDCIFTGTINGRSSGSTIGVFNGWSNSTGVSINNCVEAGTYTNNSNFNPIAFSGLISYSHNYFITPAKNSNYVYGTQMSTSIPDGEVYGQLTVAGNTYYIPTVVSGIGDIYELIDDPITPEPTVTYIGNSLTEGTDYTVSYSNNDAVGMATVTITGAGEFSGEKNINFIIYSSDYALIGTVEQLRNFATLVNSGVTNAKGKLIADIDLAGDDDNQWTPIGTDANKYNGTFDGQGFTIKNLYYKQQVEGVGLFGFANSGAYIKNVRVEGTVDNSTNGAGAGNGGTQTCAGGIIGKSYEATVLNCSFSGNVISYSNVGGLVGWGTATIVNCYNEGTVMFHSTANQTGGGVHGYGGSPQLKNCYNVGSVINNGSTSYAIGSLSVSGSVSNSYSRSGCVQNGSGASWDNLGITGTVMSLEDMKSEAFVTTLNTNIASLRTTYPDISEWTQDPITNLPVLKIFSSLTQDENGYYLLGSVQDWKNFAELVNTTPTANAKMTADIDLGDDQTMVGTENNKYQGTFDGQGHKLTIAYNATEDNAAPFRFVSGANIRNLHVDGTINTTQQFAGGVVARAVTSVTSISNCWSSVNIIGTYNEGSGGDTDFHGGLVAIAINASTTIDLVHLNDCLFTGSIKGGDATRSHCANFIGLQEYANSTITNCLSTATYTDQKQYNASYHWYYGGGTVSNALFLHANYTSGNGGRGTQISTEQLADGTATATLNAGRTGDDALWVQDHVTKRPMLKTFISLTHLTQDADGYYLLGSVQDWDSFATLVQTTPTANAKMTADIDLGDDQTMLGSFATPYAGIFDGQGHTLTIHYNTSGMTIESGQSYLGAAPFRDINGATIRNLHTAGSLAAD